MRDVPAVRLSTESADSAAASERDAAAEKVAATLATQGGSCRGVGSPGDHLQSTLSAQDWFLHIVDLCSSIHVQKYVLRR